MEWKSNCKFGQKPEEGSIFTLKNPLGICIHKYAGCGDNLYLSCDRLGIDTKSLDTSDFYEAVGKAKQIIEVYSSRVFLDAQAFFKSTEKIS